MAQQTTSNGTTTTTVYVGNLEEAATTGSTTTTTTYYYAKNWRFAEAVNGNFTYLASDGLGSAEVALSSSSPSATASLLYVPYGSVRYSNGTVPTDYAFTGQHSDSTSALDYYNARYYDPVAGQFTSADTLLPGNGFDILGLSRYAYVQGNPENRTDPSGNLAEAGGGSGCEPYCATGPGSAGASNTAPPHEDSHAPSGGLPPPAAAGIPSTDSSPAGEDITFTSPRDRDSNLNLPCNGMYIGICHPIRQGILNPACFTGELLAACDVHDFINDDFSGWLGDPEAFFGRAAREAQEAAGAGAAKQGIGSIEDVLRSPSLLEGKSPGEIRKLLGSTRGWIEDWLRQGTHEGQGWALREITSKGEFTDKSIRWNPGGGRHGPGPYWRVSSARGGISDRIPAGPDDLDIPLGAF